MEELLANPATTVVDVRETGEFASGHYEGAINIPLGIIPLRLDEFKAMQWTDCCILQKRKSFWYGHELIKTSWHL
jgi:rhodanese-related sulfurtransferase